MSVLRKAIDEVNATHPLPRCEHGQALRDHSGEALEPLCGCRASAELTLDEAINAAQAWQDDADLIIPAEIVTGLVDGAIGLREAVDKAITQLETATRVGNLSAYSIMHNVTKELRAALVDGPSVTEGETNDR